MEAIKDLQKTYEIISVEGEVLISSNDLNLVKEKFLSYIKMTQQEYHENGDKDEDEIEELITYFRDSFENIDYLNITLIDYGFEELVIKDSTQVNEEFPFFEYDNY